MVRTLGQFLLRDDGGDIGLTFQSGLMTQGGERKPSYDAFELPVYLPQTRFAPGRKNAIQIEINGSKGSLVFDLEDMNRLRFYEAGDPADRRGFRDILVTENVHAYAANWWPPGHILGYEHTFVHTIADFVNAVADKRSVPPTFEDGLANQIVLDAVQKSAKTRRWLKL